MEDVRKLFEGIDIVDLVRTHIESLPLDTLLRQAVAHRMQSVSLEPHIQHAVSTLQLPELTTRVLEQVVRKIPVEAHSKLAVERRVGAVSLTEYIKPHLVGLQDQVREHIAAHLPEDRIQQELANFPLEPLFAKELAREQPRELLAAFLKEKVRDLRYTDILQTSIDEHVATFPMEDFFATRVASFLKTLPVDEKLASAVQQSKAVFLDQLNTYVTPELLTPIVDTVVSRKLTSDVIERALLRAMKDRIQTEAESVAALLRRDAQSLLRQELAQLNLRDLLREEIHHAIQPHLSNISYEDRVTDFLREEGRLQERLQSSLPPILNELVAKTERMIESRVSTLPMDTLLDQKLAAQISPTRLEAKLDDSIAALEPRKQLEVSSRRILAELVDRTRIEDAVQKLVSGFDLRGLVKERVEMQTTTTPSSVGLFIKTCARDGPKMVRCLKSIQAYAEGFAGLCIVTDADDSNVYEGYVTKFPVTVRKTAYPAQAKTTCPHGIGFLWMQNIKLSWYSFCNFDAAVLLDADAVLTAKTSPDTFMGANGLWKWQMGVWDSTSQSYKAGQDMILPCEYAHTGCSARVLTRSATLAFHKWMRDTHTMSWWDFILTKPVYIWKQGLWGSHPYNAFGSFLLGVFKQDYEFTAYKPLPIQNAV
jgi:hypothetical protein